MPALSSRLIPRLAWLFLTFVGRTSRIRWHRLDLRQKCDTEQRSFIYAFWHGRQVFFPWVYRKTDSYTIVSKSKDGEYIARVIELSGMGTVRGSSSRGGMRAFMELKEKLDEGKVVGVTPDGPRGPFHAIAPGVIHLAQMTGKVILPITYSARFKLIFHNWDCFWVPLPFNSFVVGYGRPMKISPDDNVESKSEELAREMNRITDLADAACGGLAEFFFYLFYDFAWLIFSPLILLSVLMRYPSAFVKDFRSIRFRVGAPLPVRSAANEQWIWLHAASLGECRASVPFVHAVRKKYPSLKIFFTSMTAAGIDEARRMNLGDAVAYSPLDFSYAVQRVFETVKPQTVILMESELWPRWLRTAKEYGAQVGIINGRLSDRSADRYSKVKPLSRIWLQYVDFVCARDASDAQRYERIGVPKDRIQVTGNLKFDLAPAHLRGTSSAPHSRLFAEGNSVLTAGSVREGEESLVIDAFEQLRARVPGLKLIIAPRHMQNVSVISNLLSDRRITFVLRSRASSGASSADAVVWDTMGDLWMAYDEASVVFVGGSLVDKGGQNPIEPAWLSKPILFGPYMENFQEPAKLLIDSGGAFEVKSAAELSAKVSDLLSDRSKLDAVGTNARQAVDRIFGQATEKTLSAVSEHIHVS